MKDLPSDLNRVTERTVLELIRPHLPQAARADEATPETNLWDLGLDSLAIVMIMSAVEEEFGIELPDELMTQEVFATAANIASAIYSIIGSDGVQVR